MSHGNKSDINETNSDSNPCRTYASYKADQLKMLVRQHDIFQLLFNADQTVCISLGRCNCSDCVNEKFELLLLTRQDV